MIDYKAKVLECYPDAHEVPAYNVTHGLPVGEYIMRFGRLFGILNPTVKIQLGHGFNEDAAWQSAYQSLAKEGII